METWMLRLDCAHFSRKESMSMEAQYTLANSLVSLNLYTRKKKIPEKCHAENKGYEQV